MLEVKEILPSNISARVIMKAYGLKILMRARHPKLNELNSFSRIFSGMLGGEKRRGSGMAWA